MSHLNKLSESVPVGAGQVREYLSGGKVYGRYLVGPAEPQAFPYRPITWLAGYQSRLKVSLHEGTMRTHPVVEP